MNFSGYPVEICMFCNLGLKLNRLVSEFLNTHHLFDEMSKRVYHAENTTDGLSRRNILIGKYETGRLLGQGTFAKVYHGTNLVTGESVAIKVINKKEVKRDCVIMDQIEREISIMRLVRHPNVVELKEVMATKAKIFFIMEYVKGGELFAKVSRGKLKEEIARKYFQQLISAIDFCHSRGVYHRDLKPENLLLDENGDLKVSDFGLSALPDQLRNDGMLHTQCGTPAYVAPEILRKKGYGGAKADIWSCGVVLFILLAGYLPFRGDNVVKMYRKVFKAEYEFPRWFSDDSKELISKLLVADPEKRISISEIMKNAWFRTGFTSPTAFSIPQQNSAEDEDDKEAVMMIKTPPLSSPRFYNAFKLISSMSSGFNLSSLFESKRRASSIFTSKCSATEIATRLQGLAKKSNFGFVFEKDFKMRMQGRMEGRKGKLAVVAEVFEVAPEVTVVELSRSSGDTLEYVKFFDEEVRPSLKDIVWSWQGEAN